MNQKTILALVAIVATVGIVIAATTIAAPALAKEKDTRSNPNPGEVNIIVKERDTGHEVTICVHRQEEGKTVTECNR
jgi:hypothetical protein